MLDCANGATYRVAPRDLRAARRRRSRRSASSPTGATSTTAAARPTSRHLAERVAASDAEIGFAFDGDGDRVLAVDAAGRVHDGDELIALAALRDGLARRARRRRRRHRDEQLRLPPGDGGGRDRGRRSPRSATATCSTSCARATGRSAASSPATSSPPTIVATGDGIAAALLTMRELGGARPRRRRSPMEKLPQTPGQRRGRRPRGARRRRRRLGGGRARRARPSRAAAACSCAPPAPSRWSG